MEFTVFAFQGNWILSHGLSLPSFFGEISGFNLESDTFLEGGLQVYFSPPPPLHNCSATLLFFFKLP